MRLIFGFAMCAAGAAGAQEIENCREWRAFDDRWDGVECDITNTTEVALAKFRYSVRLTEDGRTVPWAVEGEEGQPPRWSAVPGGIEPGETVTVNLRPPFVSRRADPDALTVNVEILEALDVNDQPITD